MNPNKSLIILIIVLTLAPVVALGFTGPSVGQTPGSGGGAIFASGTYIGIGTSTPQAILSISVPSGDWQRFERLGQSWAFQNNSLNFLITNLNTSNALLTLTTGGNVGIATTSPGQALDVNGNIRTNGSILGTYSGTISALNVTGPAAFGYYNQSVYNYAFPGALAVGTSTTSGLQYSLDVVGTTNLQSFDAGNGLDYEAFKFDTTSVGLTGRKFVIGHGNQTAWTGIQTNYGTAANSGFFVRGSADSNYFLVVNGSGNVGIGTTTPSYAGLQIQESSTAGYGLKLTNRGNTRTWGLAVDAVTVGDQGFIIDDVTAGVTRFMIATSTGNVGIGTTGPGVKLDVVGTIRDSAEIITPQVNSGSNGIALNFNNGASTNMVITGGGNVGIGTTSPGAKFEVHDGTDLNVFIRNAVSPAWMEIGAVNDAFGTFKELQFTASKFNFNNGNVGIATTTPGYTLTVNGNIKVAGSLSNGVIFADGSVQTVAFQGGVQIINASYISQGTFGSNTSGSNNSYIFRPTNNGTAFFQVIATSTGDVVFNIDTSNERVGIGTASPAATLHVLGPSSGAGTPFLVNGPSTTYHYNFQVQQGGTNTFRIDSNGSVIVDSQGNNAPPLTLNLGAYSGDVLVLQKNSGPDINFLGTSGVALGQIDVWNSNKAMHFYTNGATLALTLDSSQNAIFAGNVGIGTTTPSYALDVPNGGRLGNLLAQGSIISNAADRIYLQGSNSCVTIGNPYSPSGSGITECNSGTIQAQGGSWATANLSLNPSGGNVGIGIANPGEKLDVAGNIHFGVSTASPYVYSTERQIWGSTNSGTAGPYYAKIYSNTALSVAKTLHFILRSQSYSEYSAEVTIHIPQYSGYNTGSYGLPNTGNGPEVEISMGGLTSQPQALVSIIETNVPNNGVSPFTELWLKINPPNLATVIFMKEFADNTEPNLLTIDNGSIAWTTIAPSNQQREYSFVQGAKNINGTLYVLRNGNVGIATTTPGSTLTVSGNGLITGNLTVNGTISGSLAGSVVVNASNVTAGTFGYPNYTGNYGFMSSSTNSTAAFYVKDLSANTVLDVDTTNQRVGIGTASPGNPLHVVTNTANDQYQTVFENLNTGQTRVAVKNSGAQAQFEVDVLSTGVIQFQTGKTQYAGTSLNMYSGSFGLMNGNVGIGTTTPGALLHLYSGAPYLKMEASVGTNYVQQDFVNTGGTVRIGAENSVGGGLLTGTSPYAGIFGTTGAYPLQFSTSNSVRMTILSGGNVGIATTTPGSTLTVNGNSWFGNQITANAQINILAGGIAMNSTNITGVGKITVGTIDPLYEIGGQKYATYVAAIAGGVKEEYVGKAKLSEIPNNKLLISNQNSNNQSGLEIRNSKLEIGGAEYAYVIDFDKLERGSDLWLWRKAVDFSADNVEVLATPIGVPVPIAYQIEGNKIIFRAELTTNNYQLTTDGIDFSYRLIGKRFDWMKWPTYAADQSEAAGLIVK